MPLEIRCSGQSPLLAPLMVLRFKNEQNCRCNRSYDIPTGFFPQEPNNRFICNTMRQHKINMVEVRRLAPMYNSTVNRALFRAIRVFDFIAQRDRVFA